MSRLFISSVKYGNFTHHVVGSFSTRKEDFRIRWACSMKPLDCGWQVVVCLCLIPRRFVNASNYFEQNYLPLSVTTSLGTPNLIIKCYSMDFSIGTESLNATGVVIIKPGPRSLMVSMYLFSRDAWSSSTRSMCIISNRPGLLNKLLNVLRLCRESLHV